CDLASVRIALHRFRMNSTRPADIRQDPMQKIIALLKNAGKALSRSTATAVTWTLFATTLALAQIPKPTHAPRPMTPQQSAAAFKLPEGFRMEVVASEPLIASPSAVAWDERGQMFVSELHGYNLAGQLDIEELNKTGKLDTEVRRVQAHEKFKRLAKAGTFG